MERERIVVMGLGGVGCAALSSMMDRGVEGVHFIAADTDEAALGRNGAPEKILLKDGEDLMPLLEERLAGADIFFLVAGMGRGVEASLAPAIAGTVRWMGVLTLGIALLPPGSKSPRCPHTAQEDVKNFREAVDALVILDSDSPSEPGKERPIADAAQQVVRNIADLLNKPGFINLDFRDIREILYNAGWVFTGSGLGLGKDRARQAARNAMQSLSASIGGAKRILMTITTGPDAALSEMTEAAEAVKEAATPEIMVWAHVIDDEAGDLFRVTLLTADSPVPRRSYYNGYEEMVKCEGAVELAARLDGGMNVYQKDKNFRSGHVSFFEAVVRWGTAEQVKLCVARGADPDFAEQEGERGSALEAAIEFNNLETLRALIESGADVKAADKSGETPLMYVAQCDRWGRMNLDAAKVLIEAGADVNAKDALGRVALGIALDASESITPAPPVGQFMKTLLKAGADLNLLSVHRRDAVAPATSDSQRPTLWRAISQYDVEGVKAILQSCGDIKSILAPQQPYFNSRQPRIARLHLCSNVFPEGDSTEEARAMKRKLDAGTEILKLLRAAGVDLPPHGPRGTTLSYLDTHSPEDDDSGELPDSDFMALRCAASPLALKALIDSGVDVNAKGADGDTALSVLISNCGLYFKAEEMVRILLDAGADFELSQMPDVWRGVGAGIWRRDLYALLHCMARIKVVETLIKFGKLSPESAGYPWDQNVVARHLRRSLWEAIYVAFAPRRRGRWGNWELDQDVEEDLKDMNNVNLMAAAYCGDKDEVLKLLGEGADVNTCTQDGYTPLMFAAAFRTADVVQVLLENGADVNARSFQRQTALTLAILCEPYAKVMRVLAEAGADVNAAHDDGSTPLMLAVQYCGDAEVAAELIDAGANVNAKRGDGKTALVLAIAAERFGAVRSLLAARANPAPLLKRKSKLRRVNKGALPCV